MSFTINWLWFFVKYLGNSIRSYENFYNYLLVKPELKLDKKILKKGMWLSRSLGSSLDPIPYCQHHGVVVDVVDEQVYVAHFQENQVKKETFEEFMGEETIVNIYEENNPDAKLPDVQEYNGHYNLITNNCEHLSSFIVHGKKESKQVQVVEYIAWNGMFGKMVEVPESYKRPLHGRFYL